LSIPKEEGRQTQLDFGGAVLSALGLAFVVMGVLQASNYGWLEARQPFKIGGIELIPQGGISPVVIFVAVGVLILVFFALWERHQARINKEPLVNLSIFRKRAASAGLLAILAMMFMQAGCLFVIPVFMQMALGYNALRTGLTLLPLSIAIILVASQSSKLVEKFAARALVQLGLLAMSVGVAVTALTMTSTSSNWSFLPGLLIIGVGIGLANAPLLNLVQSSVPAKQQSEISGVNRAFSNLGGSLGIAVAGAILMASLMASLSSLVAQSPVLPTEDKPKLEQIVHKDARTVSNVQLSTYIKSEGPPQAIANELVKINAEARDGALRKALAAVGVLGLFGFAMSFLLPGRRRAEEAS
jgi:Na+/melibiose symporter-like transporter